MKRTVASLVAALLVIASIDPAVCVGAQSAGPFPVVPLNAAPHRSHLRAYASLVAGAGLIGGSFAFAKRADRTYDEYLVATERDAIEDLFDRTAHYDRLAGGALLTGEVLVAAGLYLRFLRRPPAARLGLDLSPRRCAATLRF